MKNSCKVACSTLATLHIKCVNGPVSIEAKCLHNLITVTIPKWWSPDLSLSTDYLIYNAYEHTVSDN